MSLINVTSTNDQSTGILQTLFRDPFDIKAKSQVALINASIPLAIQDVNLTGVNNIEFIVNTASDFSATAVIPPGQYDLASLRQTIEQQLNKVTRLFSVSSNPHFTQWKCLFANDDDRLTIQYRVNIANKNLGKAQSHGVAFDDGLNAYTCQKPTPSTQFLYHFIASDADFNQGAGEIACGFRDTNGDNASNGFVGLIRKSQLSNAITGSDTIDIRNVDIAVKCDGVSTDPYQIKLPGATTLVNIEKDDGSQIRIEDEDTVNITYAEDDPTAILVIVQRKDGQLESSKDYRIDDTYGPWQNEYRGIIGLRNVNTRAVPVSFVPNPYQESIDSSVLRVEEISDIHHNSIVSVPSTTPVFVSINFTGSFGYLLGFQPSDITSMTNISGTFRGSLPINFTGMPSSIHVELANLGGINSFSSQGRLPIIATIPSIDIKSNLITYNAPDLVYIDLNNMSDVKASDVVLRIMDTFAGTPLPLSNRGVCVSLLIRQAP